MSITVVLADDEQMVRSGLRLILETEPDIEVVGEAGDGGEALELTRRLDPDVVLMDVQMPVMNGIEATRAIVALGRDETSRVLILTTFDLDEYVYEGFQAGASGFLLKRTPAADLVAGIRIVAAGDGMIAPSVTTRLIATFRDKAERAGVPRDPAVLDDLTAREHEVLVLVARGMTNGEIAAHLFLSTGTVKTHVKRIFAKLGLHDRTQAVILAYEVGLVRPGESAAARIPLRATTCSCRGVTTGRPPPARLLVQVAEDPRRCGGERLDTRPVLRRRRPPAHVAQRAVPVAGVPARPLLLRVPLRRAVDGPRPRHHLGGHPHPARRGGRLVAVRRLRAGAGEVPARRGRAPRAARLGGRQRRVGQAQGPLRERRHLERPPVPVRQAGLRDRLHDAAQHGGRDGVLVLRLAGGGHLARRHRDDLRRRLAPFAVAGPPRHPH